MKIIKPQKLGVIPKPYTFCARHHLCVGTLVFFRLGQTDSSAHVINDHQAWPDVGAALPSGTPLDFGIHKLRGEVLLAGSAFAPGGRPTRELEVRLQLASIDKRLVVRGDRNWQYSLVPLYQETPVQPFTRMPLTWERAFGGQGFAPNELGKGFLAGASGAFAGQNQGPLPNLEYPDERVTAGKRSYRSACFLPLDFSCPERQKKAGTYDQQWLERDFPGFARDIDWSIFNAAPTDQWLSDTLQGATLFRGGEPYRLENLHPERPVLEGCLPKLRSRVFLRTAAEAIREAPSRADTVWFFPEQLLGVMVFHATAEVTDSEALDVQALMVAYELSAGEPRSIDHYLSVMDLRLDQKTALMHAFNESQLCPPRARLSPEAAQARQLAESQAAIDDVIAELKEKGVPFPADFEVPKATPPPFPVPTQEELDSGDFDLTAMMEGAEAAAEALKQQGETVLAELEHKLPEVPVVPVNVVEEVTVALARADGSAVASRIAALKTQTSEEHSAALQALAEQLPKLAALSPKALPESAADAVAQALATYVTDALRERRSLRGADLTGVHLHDVDLRGSDLEGTVFAYARLTRVHFDGACLKNATFAHSRLQSVSFAAADLTDANFSNAQLVENRLHSARLARSQWQEATVTGCEFSEADLDNVLFIKTRLERCSFVKARLQGGAWTQVNASHCDFRQSVATQWSLMECQLDAPDFSASQLQRVVWLGTEAPQSRFVGARLERVLFSGRSRLPGASFDKARARDCGFRGTDLSRSTFDDATLSRCDLAETNLSHSCFRHALVSRCGLRQANGTRSDFEDADLYQTVMTKADWTGARFCRASLFGVEAGGAIWHGTDLRDATPRPERSV